MNQYMNYRKWRLANIYKSPLNNPEDFSTTPAGHNLEVKVGDHLDFSRDDLFDKSYYHLHEIFPPEAKTNTPETLLIMTKGLENSAHNLMHHAIATHDKLLPYREVGKDEYLPKISHDEDSTDRYTVKDRGKNKAPHVVLGGSINNEADLADKISDAFSGILLQHLNSRSSDIYHPGMDIILDSTESSHNPHLDISEKDLKGPRRERLRANANLAEYHRKRFRDYLQHHLEDPYSHLTYNEFLEASTGTAEQGLVDELLKNILTGFHTKFKPINPQPAIENK